MSQQFSDLSARLDELDVKIGTIEKLQAELQEKSPDSAIVSEVKTLISKVNALEKQMTSPHTQKKSSTDSTMKSKVAPKRYHEVKKGETLYRISSQYGITVDELLRLNKLPANQPIEVGQKLLISK
jgi:LysM repeat protein